MMTMTPKLASSSSQNSIIAQWSPGTQFRQHSLVDLRSLSIVDIVEEEQEQEHDPDVEPISSDDDDDDNCDCPESSILFPIIRKSALSELERLAAMGGLFYQICSFLYGADIQRLRQASQFLYRLIRPDRMVPNLQNMLLFYRRQLGVGNLDFEDNSRNGLIEFLDVQSIANLNCTCRDIRCATDVMFETRRRVARGSTNDTAKCCRPEVPGVPIPLRSIVCLPGEATQPQRSPRSPDITDVNSPGLTQRRCLAMPHPMEMNFNLVDSVPLMLAMLKRCDPRKVSRVLGSLSNKGAGTRRQFTATAKTQIAKELCHTIAHMKNVTSIDLNGWHINDNWLASFAKSVGSSRTPHLSEVRVAYPALEGHASSSFAMSRSTIAALCSSLRSLEKLAVLDFSGIKIRDEFADPLIVLIVESRSLRKVWLKATKLGDDFVRKLILAFDAEQVKDSDWKHSLSALSLQNCSLSRISLEILAAHVMKFNQVRQENRRNSDGAGMFRSAEHGGVRPRRRTLGAISCPLFSLSGNRKISQKDKEEFMHLDLFLSLGHFS